VLLDGADANSFVPANAGVSADGERSVHHARELDRPVAPLVQHRHHAEAGEGAHFVKHGSAAQEEEPFDLLERLRRRRLEQTEPERLGHGRADAVEHGVSSRDFDPAGAAQRGSPCAGLHEHGVRVRLGTLEAPREIEVGEIVPRFTAGRHGRARILPPTPGVRFIVE
jgi:hypothetical protein